MPEMTRRSFLKLAGAAAAELALAPHIVNEAIAGEKPSKFRTKDIIYNENENINADSFRNREIRELLNVANEVLTEYPLLFNKIRISSTQLGGGTTEINAESGDRIIVIGQQCLYDQAILRELFWHECGHMLKSIGFFKDRYPRNSEANEKLLRLQDLYLQMRGLAQQGSPILSWFVETTYLPKLLDQNLVSYRTKVPNEFEMYAMGFSVSHVYTAEFWRNVKSGTAEEQALVKEYFSFYPSPEEIADIIHNKQY